MKVIDILTHFFRIPNKKLYAHLFTFTLYQSGGHQYAEMLCHASWTNVQLLFQLDPGVRPEQHQREDEQPTLIA